jgi:hypothetical protein
LSGSVPGAFGAWPAGETTRGTTPTLKPRWRGFRRQSRAHRYQASPPKSKRKVHNSNEHGSDPPRPAPKGARDGDVGLLLNPRSNSKHPLYRRTESRMNVCPAQCLEDPSLDPLERLSPSSSIVRMCCQH